MGERQKRTYAGANLSAIEDAQAADARDMRKQGFREVAREYFPALGELVVTYEQGRNVRGFAQAIVATVLVGLAVSIILGFLVITTARELAPIVAFVGLGVGSIWSTRRYVLGGCGTMILVFVAALAVQVAVTAAAIAVSAIAATGG